MAVEVVVFSFVPGWVGVHSEAEHVGQTTAIRQPYCQTHEGGVTVWGWSQQKGESY